MTLPRTCRLLLAAWLACACSRAGTRDVELQAGSSDSGDAGAGVFGTSRIAGHIRFHGKAPPDVERPSKLAFPECSNFGPPDVSLALSPEGGVAQAFVWISAGLPPGAYPRPTTPVQLDQLGCEYRPRVFGVRAGQAIQIRNSDPLLHNTHAFGTGLFGGFNVPLPQRGDTATRVLAHPEVPTVLGCDVHGWMRAYAGVVENPFFAVTDGAGAFELAKLPGGRYTLSVWQERLGRRSVPVEVAPEGAATLELELADR